MHADPDPRGSGSTTLVCSLPKYVLIFGEYVDPFHPQVEMLETLQESRTILGWTLAPLISAMLNTAGGAIFIGIAKFRLYKNNYVLNSEK